MNKVLIGVILGVVLDRILGLSAATLWLIVAMIALFFLLVELFEKDTEEVSEEVEESDEEPETAFTFAERGITIHEHWCLHCLSSAEPGVHACYVCGYSNSMRVSTSKRARTQVIDKNGGVYFEIITGEPPRQTMYLSESEMHRNRINFKGGQI